MNLENEVKNLIRNLNSSEGKENNKKGPGIDDLGYSDIPETPVNNNVMGGNTMNQGGRPGVTPQPAPTREDYSKASLFEADKDVENIPDESLSIGSGMSNGFNKALEDSLKSMQKATLAFSTMQEFSQELENSIKNMEEAMESFKYLMEANEKISKVQESIIRANASYEKMEDAVMNLK